MYEGIFQRSPVKQMVVSETPTRWSVKDMTPMPIHLMAAPTPLNFPSYHLPPTFSATASWNDDHQLPESWSQTFMEGLVNEDDKLAQQEKDFEINWNRHFVVLSPKSKQGHSYECNYSGGIAKKAKIQHSSAKTIIKVRKEKLGDRITALHQLVSPFGKTDTATVLLEAIGYIKFLEKQIEALSVPYMVRGGSGRSMKQRHLEYDEEAKKDLRSRGLCLVPLNLYTSCWE